MVAHGVAQGFSGEGLPRVMRHRRAGLPVVQCLTLALLAGSGRSAAPNMGWERRLAASPGRLDVVLSRASVRSGLLHLLQRGVSGGVCAGAGTDGASTCARCAACAAVQGAFDHGHASEFGFLWGDSLSSCAYIWLRAEGFLRRV